MRTLNELHPKYQDQVEVVPVAFDLAESEGRLRQFFEGNNYPWDPALGRGEVFSDYRVLIRSTKVAVDRNGVIAFRGGYGRMSLEAWEGVFLELIE